MKEVSLGNIAIAGRWASESSCREYLRKGEVFVLRLLKLTNQAAQDRLKILMEVSLGQLFPR